MADILLFPIRCRTCGKLVEEARRCYAIPTCYGCLPPPEPLPIVEPKKRRQRKKAEPFVPPDDDDEPPF